MSCIYREAIEAATTLRRFRSLDTTIVAATRQRNTEEERWPALECGNASECSTKDERVHIVRAFIGVDGFQIHHVPHDLIFIADAITAVHISGMARNIKRFSDIVTLDERDHLRREPAFIH